MSRTSSLSGLGRGRARGRRDIAEDEQLAERRPGRFRVEGWEGELAGTQSDAESKWITMEYNAPSPVFRLHYVSKAEWTRPVYLYYIIINSQFAI